MSTTESAGESSAQAQAQVHQQPEPGRTFERLVDKLIRDRALCAWCFAKRRQIHQEYDEALADHLRLSGRGSALQVISATSSPDPRTYSEVVPPKRDADQPWIITEPARPRCICGGCAEIDIDLDHHRPNGVLEEAAENMVIHLNREYDRDLDGDAAVERVRELTSSGCAGQDRKTLAAALRAGFEGSE